ncbi:hypothetical protein SAMN04488565_0629 [Leucobacter chromiiresistens]|uniref:Uncharacterized protein n=2 Tax=Leucobacter chromiiresistens TaxID=1079994 RepID=A0A1H0Y8I1_9MICO|nr:hypothetical protein SAMN04488565_0629 [Leucobacter chromiiresistens]
MMLTQSDTAQTRAQDNAARLWAASHLADLPTVTRFVEQRVRRALDSQGRWVRQAFAVTVRLEEPRRFMIHLYTEATLRDLQTAQRVVECAKVDGVGDQVRGGDLWARTEYGWRWMGGTVEAGTERHDDEVRECRDAACVDQWHSWSGDEQNEPCALEIRRPADWCTVHAFRFHGRPWEASCSAITDPTEGPQGLQEIRALAEAYEQMQAECDRLNNQTIGAAA